MRDCKLYKISADTSKFRRLIIGRTTRAQAEHCPLPRRALHPAADGVQAAALPRQITRRKELPPHPQELRHHQVLPLA